MFWYLSPSLGSPPPQRKRDPTTCPCVYSSQLWQSALLPAKNTWVFVRSFLTFFKSFLYTEWVKGILLGKTVACRQERDTARRTTKSTDCHSTPENQAAVTFSRLFLQVYLNLSLFETPENTFRPSCLNYFSQTIYYIKHQLITSATGRKTVREKNLKQTMYFWSPWESQHSLAIHG